MNKMALLISHWHVHVRAQMRKKKKTKAALRLFSWHWTEGLYWKLMHCLGCLLLWKEPALQRRRFKRCEFVPWVRKSSWRRTWQPTPAFLPGESHGQRSLVGYSPWGRRVGYDWACTHTEKWVGACVASCSVCEGLTWRDNRGAASLTSHPPVTMCPLPSPTKEHCPQTPNSAHIWSSSNSFCSLGICWAGSPHSLTMTCRTQTNSIARHHCSSGNEVPPPCSSPQEMVGAELPSPAAVLSSTVVKNAFWSVTCF